MPTDPWADKQERAKQIQLFQNKQQEVKQPPLYQPRPVQSISSLAKRGEVFGFG